MIRPHPYLLEISAWPWLDRLSRHLRRHVTLADVPGEEWDRVVAHRCDVVFLMGVWRRSAIGREMARTDPSMRAEYDRALPGWTEDDVPGSPYCIADYVPDERMGGWAGLDAARAEINRRGARLVVDFVPNHTGFDHPWTGSHPERYVLGTAADAGAAPGDFRSIDNGRELFVACGRDPYFAPWRDVAQLNYFNPDTRLAMIRILHTIQGHCDGVRCDMAMLVVNDVFERTWRRVLRDAWPRPADEFWPAATTEVPALIYLAEVYWNLEAMMIDQGFDFAYDKRLVDSLHAPAWEAPGRVRELLLAQQPPPQRLARFLENHDEPRAAATLHERLPAAVALTSTLPGMRFFFDGQFEGRRVKSPVQLGRWVDEAPAAAIRELYDRALHAAAEDVFHQGDWRMIDAASCGDPTFTDIVAWRWRGARTLAVVAINLGDRQAQANLSLAGDLPDGTVFDFDDRLTGLSYRWHRERLAATGLYVKLDGGDAHLFTVRANR